MRWACLSIAFSLAALAATARAEPPSIQPTGPVRIERVSRSAQLHPLEASIAIDRSSAAWDRYAYATPNWYYGYCGYGYGYGCGFYWRGYGCGYRANTLYTNTFGFLAW